MKQTNNSHQKPLKLCEKTGKVVYVSRELAISTMQYLNRFRVKGVKQVVNAYKCTHCKGWHLTSMQSEPVNNTHKR